MDTPSDKYLCNQGIEDTNHFLFLCPFFATRRATLAINVIAILQKYHLTHLGEAITPVSIGTSPLISLIIEKFSCRQQLKI